MLTEVLLITALHTAAGPVELAPEASVVCAYVPQGLRKHSIRPINPQKGSRNAALVPEPGSMALLSLGLLGVGAGLRRRRRTT